MKSDIFGKGMLAFIGHMSLRASRCFGAFSKYSFLFQPPPPSDLLCTTFTYYSFVALYFFCKVTCLGHVRNKKGAPQQ